MSTSTTPYPIFAALDAQPSRLLTRQEEHDLAVRARAGDHRARGELVERNLRLVIKIAASHSARAPQLELHDLVNEGVLGLMRAIEKFDPDSGFKLSTYASWWITQAVSRSADRDGAVTIPSDIRRELRATEHYLAEKHGTEPTTDQLYDELNPPTRRRISRHDVAAARAGMRCVSLDHAALTSDGSADPFGSLIADPHCPDPCDQVADALDLKQDIATATSQLATKERRLVDRRYGLDGCEPATLATMARELGTDTASTRRLEREVFAKMRAASVDEQEPATPVCKPAAAVLDILHGRAASRTPAQLGYARLQPVALP